MRGAGQQVDEHLVGDLGAGMGGLQRLGVPLPPVSGVDRIRQAGEHEHEGRTAGIHRAVAESGGLDDALLGAEGSGRADRREARGRSGAGLLQSRARGGGGVLGDRQQGSRHRARHGGPGGVRDALVGADDLDRPQCSGVGRLGADVGEGDQDLGDQKTGVPARAAHRSVSRRPGDLDEAGAGRQEAHGVAGGAHGEQDIGAGVRVRDREDVEGVDERACDLSRPARQTQPGAQNRSGQGVRGNRGGQLAARLPCHAAFALATGGSAARPGGPLPLYSSKATGPRRCARPERRSRRRCEERSEAELLLDGHVCASPHASSAWGLSLPSDRVCGLPGARARGIRSSAVTSSGVHARRFRSETVAAVCDVCGKGPIFGKSVSHSHVRTNRRWNPNIQRVRALVNGAPKRLNVCTSCLKAGKVTRNI